MDGSAASPPQSLSLHRKSGAMRGVATQSKDGGVAEAEARLQRLRQMLKELREAIRETQAMIERAERARPGR